ncbi:hypothetical protein POX_a00440 [Penicillium oxalicum]|uniref:hypothetical protein n=1 Tax=Penicillium oxalicum TaxID=69781 RepID=UPI0020B8AFDA|nr:hypothetical protein POX_a00440 [Penicillium oxalicum]KAI2793853.1 hypothetical protein POX_a00440 [Penicillium oxalicum]
MDYLEIRDSNLSHENGNPYVSSRGMQGLVMSVVFTSLAASFVVVRLYTRIKFLRRLEANDWMIVVALVNSFIFMGLDIVEATSGMGMHLADIPPEILERQMKAFWLTIPFYNAAVLCAKASILMQYFRVFPTRRMRIVCWVLISMLAIYGTWCIISAFLTCIPVAKFWNPTLPGYCLSRPGLWFSNASMHITTDLAILIIPIPALIAIDIPKKQKNYPYDHVRAWRIVNDNVGAASWSAIECNTGIICACLPTLKPLLSKILPGLVSTFAGSKPTRTSIGPIKRAPPTWADVSTLGAPHEDPEYASRDPETIGGTRFSMRSDMPGNRESLAEKGYPADSAYLSELIDRPDHHRHQNSVSTCSFVSRV